MLSYREITERGQQKGVKKVGKERRSHGPIQGECYR
jgi:hypothetical protein